jgi:hypothetical protein
MKALLQRESRLLLALLALVVLMNVPYGRWALYPFTLFSTWVHECCHGLAAIVLGGHVEWLKIHSDGSGLAMTARPVGRLPTAFVASAGYIGTALFGALLLLLRRFERAPRIGVVGLGGAIVLSVVFWVRNPFGIVVLLAIGAALLAAGLKAPKEWSAALYAFLAATCCLNAFTSIQVLFSPHLQVAGEATSSSDATTVAEALWLPHWFWASSWMALALVLVALGLRFGSPPAKPGEVGEPVAA